MANSNILSYSRTNDHIDATPPATPTTSNEQLKCKFKLATIDDVENKKKHQIKEKSDEIKTLLSLRSDRFTIVAHGVTKSHLASWWLNFGFAKETIAGETFTVANFVSCAKCFTTYRYGSCSTESISRHQCHGLTSSSSSSCNSMASDHLFTLDKHLIKHKNPFRHSEQQHLTKLFCTWICDNLRPISIIEDRGLREICSYFYDLGVKNAARSMDIETLFQSRQTVSRCITDQAAKYREQLTELINEPMKNHALTVSPDLWSDRYRQLSYLGATVTFVDSYLQFRKFTLCCRSFPVELTKTGENISKVLKEELNRYGIEKLDCVHWVSDRGSNFIRCFNLNMVDPILCFAHRIHNVLTITFIGKKIEDYFNNEDLEDIPDNIGQQEFLDDELMPFPVKRILLTICYTKALVKYLKLSNLNELIVKFGSQGTTTLNQSVITRWLSLFSCVESVYMNYDAVVLALESRRTTKYINDLTKYNLLDLLLLLAPLNAALQAIQIDEGPSLHLVIPFYQKLLNDYSTYSKLVSTVKKKYPVIFQTSFAVEYLSNESAGVEFFRQRIHTKLIEMFVFDDRHYMAMCLHPALREMDGVSYQIKTNCYNNIRKYIQDEEIRIVDTTTNHISSSKKRKILHHFLDEDDDREEEQNQSFFDQTNVHTNEDDIELFHKIEFRRSSSASSMSTEFSYRTNYRAYKPDELDEYLEANFPSSIVQENPLQFWSSDLATVKFPLLKSLARKILSIPATSSGTERLFSSSGIILNNRRQRLSPDQFDNMLVIRSARQVLSKVKQADSTSTTN